MAVTWNEPGLPVVNVVPFALVIAGAWSTVNVKACEAGVPTPLLVSLPIWGTASIAFGIFCIMTLSWRVLPGGADGRRMPDFLNATRRSWAAWLPFFVITGVSVYAVAQWPQWWLFLLPGLPVAMLGPVLPALRRYLDALP